MIDEESMYDIHDPRSRQRIVDIMSSTIQQPINEGSPIKHLIDGFGRYMLTDEARVQFCLVVLRNLWSIPRTILADKSAARRRLREKLCADPEWERIFILAMRNRHGCTCVDCLKAVAKYLYWIAPMVVNRNDMFSMCIADMTGADDLFQCAVGRISGRSKLNARKLLKAKK